MSPRIVPSARSRTRFYLFLQALLWLAPSVEAQTLFGHYRFDNPADLNIDSSGLGHHADGPFVIGKGGQVPQYTPTGVAGGAVQFNGTNGIIWSTNSPANLPPVLTTNYSISLWLKTTQVYATDGNPAPFGAGILSTLSGDPVPMALTGSKLAFYTGNPFHDLHSTFNINSGQFTHLVVTRNAATGVKQIYFNGVLNASGTGGTGPAATSPLAALGYGFTSSVGLVGVIDDLQVYQGVLSASQVSFLFNNPGSSVMAMASLGDAVDAPELSWTTGGNANWVAQTTNTFDGMDAAQSGAVGNNQSSYLQTVVQGPGTLTFRWKVSSQSASDLLQFLVNGVSMASISGITGWLALTNQLGAGSNTLRWQYTKDASGSAGEDRGWVDTVSYIPQIDVNLVFQFERANASYYSVPDAYFVFPFFRSISPLPNSIGDVHRAESPNMRFIGQQGGEFVSRSTQYTSLTDVINEATNGFWRLYLNKGSPAERLYMFTVSVSGLDTNVLGRTMVLSPTNGSVNVSTNPTVYWNGPDWPSLVDLGITSLPNFTNSTSITLPVGSKDLTLPARPYGTNRLSLTYTTNDVPYLQATTPTNVTLPALHSWVTSANLISLASIDFVVGASVPMAVQDTSLIVSNGTASVSFTTQAGRTHFLQTRTNLTTAPWTTLTNFVGDGSLQELPLPITAAPEGYYRVVTQ